MTPKRAAGDVFRAFVGPLVLVSVLAPTAPNAASATCTRPAKPPNPSSAANQLQSVAVVSACNAWAVGYYDKGTVPQTLIEHWNGTRWRRVTSPNPGGAGHSNLLNAVAVSQSGKAWAVGFYEGRMANQTLILNWNGARWRRLPSSNPGGSAEANYLNGVAATPTGCAWAVGDYFTGTGFKTLAIRC